MKDPFEMLEGVPPDLRTGFEMGLVYGDLVVGGTGPWIVRDAQRELYEKMLRVFNRKAVFEAYDDQDNCPWPMMVVRSEKISLRLV